MSVTQTVEVPADGRLIIDVPSGVPPGPVILTFTPLAAQNERTGQGPQNAGPVNERVFGCAKGQFKMADDFDAPLDDFKDYM